MEASLPMLVVVEGVECVAPAVWISRASLAHRNIPMPPRRELSYRRTPTNPPCPAQIPPRPASSIESSCAPNDAAFPRGSGPATKQRACRSLSRRTKTGWPGAISEQAELPRYALESPLTDGPGPQRASLGSCKWIVEWHTSIPEVRSRHAAKWTAYRGSAVAFQGRWPRSWRLTDT